jgi:hypothetical protein
MATTNNPPTLQLVPRSRPKRPARAPSGPTEDIAAWGLVVDALEQGLKLSLSDRARRHMVRTHALVSHLARRPLLRATGGDA